MPHRHGDTYIQTEVNLLTSLLVVINIISQSVVIVSVASKQDTPTGETRSIFHFPHISLSFSLSHKGSLPDPSLTFYQVNDEIAAVRMRMAVGDAVA